MASKVSKKTPPPPTAPPPNTSCPHVYASECPEGMLLALLLQPRASRNAFVGIHHAKLKISLTSPPVDNQANEALCRFLAQAFEVSKAHIQLLSGHSSRSKKVLVHGSYPQLLQQLGHLLSGILPPNFRL